ncbi:MAG: hypothetical protein OXG11_06840 [Chloroflexi bacterium]|nr:hypothetical protein [Chloroflexota bacterium]
MKYQVRNYFKQPFSVDELSSLLAGRSVRDFLSRRSKKFRELKLDTADFTDDQLIELMVEDPTLIRRPLVVVGEQIIAGFDRREFEEIGAD